MPVSNPNPLHLIAALILLAATAWPCTVTGITSNVELVKTADAIVRAKAADYDQPPSDPLTRTTGPPDSRVRFQVLETVRGEKLNDVIIPGYLGNADDFNEKPAPYSFVRPGGRSGSCFANTYRKGAEYLLFLRKNDAGELTVNWAALAPVNEQLHSADDPWVVWVRQQTAKLSQAPKKK